MSPAWRSWTYVDYRALLDQEIRYENPMRVAGHTLHHSTLVSRGGVVAARLTMAECVALRLIGARCTRASRADQKRLDHIHAEPGQFDGNRILLAQLDSRQ